MKGPGFSNPLSILCSCLIAVFVLTCIFGLSAGQELEKDTVESSSDSLTTEKKLAVYDKIFVAYQDAKRHIRDDLVRCFTSFHCASFGFRLLEFHLCIFI